MRMIKIRNMIIGEGIPKICVSLVGTTYEEILEKAKKLKEVPMDFVEWRADWYEEVFSIEKVMEILQKLRELLDECPILFTFRTKEEGGEKKIPMEDYVKLLKKAAFTGLIDLLDVEVFHCSKEQVSQIIEVAHQKKVAVIGSNHDFEKTDTKEELVSKLCRMQGMGVDIPKLAVMPKNKFDTLTLLEATLEMKQKHSDRPLITMSMAQDGVISRVAGEVFGSDVTFGCVGTASAPGQLPSEELKKVLEILHHALG